jgi:hypothetical protein
MMRRGWFGESYRHYLASKSIKTKYQKKFKNIVKPFAGENPRITEKYARFRQRDPDEFVKGSFRTKKIANDKEIVVGKEKKSKKYEVQSILVKRKRYWDEKDADEEELEDLNHQIVELQLRTLPKLSSAEQRDVNGRTLKPLLEKREALKKQGVRVRGSPIEAYWSKRVLVKKGRSHVTRSGEEVEQRARETVAAVRPFAARAVVAGSIRRGVPAPVDVDVVVVPKRESDIPKIKDIVKKGATKVYQDGNYKLAVRKHGIKTEVVFAKPREFGATLMYATGPSGANIHNRQIAKSKGWKLSQYGLFDKQGKLLASSERSIYRKLGKSYREPEQRGLPR